MKLRFIIALPHPCALGVDHPWPPTFSEIDLPAALHTLGDKPQSDYGFA